MKRDGRRHDSKANPAARALTVLKSPGWYAGCSVNRAKGRILIFWEVVVMSILAWIVLGLIAGAIAKALMPGRDPGGIIVTILIGIVGAFLGGFLGNAITGHGLSGFSAWSIILAVLGAMLLLWIYRLTTRSRTTHTTL
jgi:uncharacterized membrane protein YeaQ/YmgE (transglycosylase-associated protein family)